MSSEARLDGLLPEAAPPFNPGADKSVCRVGTASPVADVGAMGFDDDCAGDKSFS